LAQAKIDSLVANTAMIEANLDNRVNTVLTQLGGEKKTEEYFGKTVYELREDWREIITEQSLTQDMQSRVQSTIVEMTPKQIKEFYENVSKDSLPIISTQYQLSQIVKYPDVERAKVEVKEKLLEFRERILKGESFSMLARFYSEDPGSAAKGGELGMASKSIFWPQFSDAAMALKEGQVSPIVETPDGFHIIQMIKKEGDMFNARHILLKPKYTSEDKNKAFKTLDSLKTAIEGDSISFFLAARIHSQDQYSRTNGGLMADPNTGSTLFEKDLLKPQDYAVLKDMKVGDISVPFESVDNEGRSGNTIYKIVKLEKIIPSHVANFEEDFSVLQNVANGAQAKKAIDNFVNDKIKTTYIVIDPLFHNCDFEREGWIK
ncbi:MAG: peptidylprolyl isomerase, partial [Bacteroidales bacterium]|nr:peptidylprolyl isomerase [Bacteroidales bacterium]